MKRTIIVSLLILGLGVSAHDPGIGFAPVALAADTPEDVFAELDYLHFFDRHEEALEIINARTPENQREESELLWRKARAQLSTAHLSNWEGSLSDEDAIVRLEEVEEIAERAIELNPDGANAYFWRAAASGQRGQLIGVLNALFLASDIRDYGAKAVERDEKMAEAYYLLGQVYRELPGWPVSFGNDDYAVSLARRSVVLYEEMREAGEIPVTYYDNYIQLAHSLWERNNSARRRERRARRTESDYRSADSALERGFYFEATVGLSDQSDREEALEIVRWVVEELSEVDDRRLRQEMDLSDARELLNDWE